MKKRLIPLLCLVLALLCLWASAENATDATSLWEGDSVPVSGMEFSTAKRISEQSHELTDALLTGVSKNHMLLISFTVKAEKSCTCMTVSACGAFMTYYVPVQWTRIVIPVAYDGNKTLKLDPDAPILLGSCTVENLKKATYETAAGKSGMFLAEDYAYTPLPETGVGTPGAKDVLKSGNFLYVLNDNGLTVVDVSGETPKLRGSVGGIGTNVRQIALCDTGKDVILTSRAEGVFIVNVSDPDHPRIRSVYQSVEMATGLAVAGNYAFVGNRQNGVEVVDISDLDAPRHLCIIRTGEVQSCVAMNGILYCGLWNNCRVDMYDITDPCKTKLLGSAPLNGKGDGVSVLEQNGHIYLYASTGHHAGKLSSSQTYETPAYGMGNGLDVYDVTDPAKPVHLSTSKIDGRYYYQNYDMWTVKASAAGGRVYAYLLNSFNGLFIFDVTDPAAPIRLEKVDVPIAKGSPLYKEQTSGSNRVFPYDQKEAIRSPISGIAVDNGTAYLAGALSDLHIYKSKNCFACEPPKNSGIRSASETYYDFDGKQLPGYSAVRPGSLLSAIQNHGSELFVAAGARGILVYDKDLNLLNTVATEGICYDLTIRGDTLYTAEGLSGASAYGISGTELKKLWNYPTPHGVCRDVEISAGGKFLATQTGANWLDIISTQTQKSVLEQKGGAQMYYRNLLTYQGGRYLGAWSNARKEYWYDCGENDSLAKPKNVNTIDTTKCSMASSAAEYQGKMLALTSDGYYLYDPIKGGSTISGSLRKASSKLSGKPAFYKGLMVSTDRIYGHVYLADVSNSASPKVLLDLPVPGSPDFAMFYENSVYIPMGYQGLMKFDLAPWLEKVGLPFTDVSEKDWFYSFVRELYLDGTVAGMTETTFAPSGVLTYGQALKLIVCGLGHGEQAPVNGHWASGYLKFATDKGWITELLDMSKPITRLRFCRIAAKAGNLTEQPASNPFTDCDDPAVLALNKAGVINGMTETTFSPDSILTRAQISKIICALKNRK